MKPPFFVVVARAGIDAGWKGARGVGRWELATLYMILAFFGRIEDERPSRRPPGIRA